MCIWLRQRQCTGVSACGCSDTFTGMPCNRVQYTFQKRLNSRAHRLLHITYPPHVISHIANNISHSCIPGCLNPSLDDENSHTATTVSALVPVKQHIAVGWRDDWSRAYMIEGIQYEVMSCDRGGALPADYWRAPAHCCSPGSPRPTQMDIHTYTSIDIYVYEKVYCRDTHRYT